MTNSTFIIFIIAISMVVGQIFFTDKKLTDLEKENRDLRNKISQYELEKIQENLNI